MKHNQKKTTIPSTKNKNTKAIHKKTHIITKIKYKTKYKIEIMFVDVDSKELDSGDDDDKSDNEPYIYKKYYKYLNKYEEVTCYKTAPSNKFIYRKCPE